MDTLIWTDLRDRAIQAFNGETPHATLEQEIIEAFQQRPALVARAIDHVATKFQAGTIRSGWAVLRSEIRTASTAPANPTVTDISEREKRERQAEQWLRAAGIHFDRDTEVEDELFGDRGLLRHWRADEPLRQRMLDLWAQLRPTGIRLERQQLVRLGQRRIIAARAARIAKRHPEAFTDTPAPEPQLDPPDRAPEPSLT